MMQGLKNWINRQAFFPSPAGIMVNPYFIARRSLYLSMKKLSSEFNGFEAILDVGCGMKPYRELFSSPVYVGMDVPGGGHSDDCKRCDIFYDGSMLPVKNASVDGVISNEVLEHVSDPDVFLGEIRRALKPGGLLLLTVPFVWDEHEKPFDYTRYTSFGIRRLVEKCGFEIRFQSKSSGYVETVFQMLSAYVAGLFAGRNKYLGLFVAMTLCLGIQGAGVVLSKILPQFDGLYLDNIILAVKR